MNSHRLKSAELGEKLSQKKQISRVRQICGRRHALHKWPVFNSGGIAVEWPRWGFVSSVYATNAFYSAL